MTDPDYIIMEGGELAQLPLLILAGTSQQFMLLCELTGLQPGSGLIYIEGKETLAGRRQPVYLWGAFYMRLPELWEYIRATTSEVYFLYFHSGQLHRRHVEANRKD